MTYRGRVEKGVVVLEPGAQLHDGMQVTVSPIPENTNGPENAQELEELRAGLMRFSGVIKDAPPDLARNHDQYLHRTAIK
jgi:hypothetical protein